jgi:hypothetical protein
MFAADIIQTFGTIKRAIEVHIRIDEDGELIPDGRLGITSAVW